MLLLALAAAGCGRRDGVRTVGVSGTVYLDGKPVEGVEVYFVSPNHTGFGLTASDGTYELVQGAALGENRLRFSKVVNADFNDPEQGMDIGQLEAMAMAHGRGPIVQIPGQVIPPKYSDPALSKIVFQVPDGGTSGADFRLTSK
ncbi:MAG: hypothetical protein RBS80_08760 [Thermoguttaceae bacterium]|jgi:hypothetical protein|nr:hypothetical protein [Thermoguttaceae bacterium]